MPAKELMGWNEKRSRWEKMFKGERFTVAGSVLNPADPTKAGSRDAANEWWESKLAGLLGRSSHADPAVERFRKLVPSMDEMTAVIEKAMVYRAMLATGPEMEAPTPDTIDEVIGVGPLTQERRIDLLDRLTDKIGGPKVPKKNTVGQHWREWADLQFAAKKSAARKKMNVHMVGIFVSWIGEGASVERIDETAWENYWKALSARSDSEGYKARVQAEARRFIRYLASKRALVLPANLDSPLLKFRKSSPKKIKVPPMDTVRKLLEASKEKTQDKLHAMLMLNTGMLPKDISALRHDMVDWDAGTITRKRTKLADVENAPEVTYRLWPEVFAGLKKFRSEDPALVLVTKSGRPWVVEEIEAKVDGKYKNSSSIATNMRETTKRAKIKITPRQLRTFGASLLGKHPSFKFFALHWLADSPKGTANIHYVTPDQTQFDEALAWMRAEILREKK